MIFLEILFIVSLIECLITWVWFIILGFQANKVWGFSIVFLSPVTPFMFALRFARKARKAIYYYVITLIFFVSLNTYIYYDGNYFYENSWQKITKLATQITTVEIASLFDFNGLFETDTTEVLVPEIKTRPVLMRSAVIEKKARSIPTKKSEPKPYSYYKKPTPNKQSYQVISVEALAPYMNKKIIITTSVVQHKGRLVSVTASTVLIKKQTSGGSVTMPIKKNKIKQIKIYL
ncbi:MAG: hypothetical protein KAG26_00900 [Methylococcales bacterium]|nr:hypothetical protein [Methylococcales bacterium]